MSNIVEQSLKPNAKRVTYGIDIKLGAGINLNEWGLHETLAKEVNDQLTATNKPVLIPVLMPKADGSGDVEVLVEFSRRPVSGLAAALAAVKAKSAPVNV